MKNVTDEVGGIILSPTHFKWNRMTLAELLLLLDSPFQRRNDQRDSILNYADIPTSFEDDEDNDIPVLDSFKKIMGTIN